MPQPDRPRHDSAQDQVRGTTPRRPTRQRPAATSALAPSPTPLMPVPDTPSGPDRTGESRAGRRQHRRPQGGEGLELVYLAGRVPRALRDELHIRAIHEGRPVVELLRDAIRGYLDAAENTGR